MVTNQNRKMNDGSSVDSTPDIPWPYTAVFWPTHDGMNGTSFAAMSCSCPKIFSRVAESLLPCSWLTSLSTWAFLYPFWKNPPSTRNGDR